MENIDVTSFIVLVPVVMGIVEAVKRVGLSERWAPVAAIILGVFLRLMVGVTLITDVLQVPQMIVIGIVIGLTASGLYSGGKATFASGDVTLGK